MTTDRDGPTPARLLQLLADLRDALRAAPFGVPVRGLDRTAGLAAEAADQIDDYLLPRLAAPDEPLLVVLGGSTGAGKSTLLNSLVGEAVSRAGVLRPTTRSAVLVCHPDDADAFDGRGLLPSLPRDTEDRPGTVRIVATAAVPAGLAFVDTPDVDSVVAGNRDIAARLIAAADVWTFVTTASRYADDLPWTLLRRAAGRDASVAVVLSRTDGTTTTSIRNHLAELLQGEGLGSAPLFVVPRTTLQEGLLPDEVVAPIKGWAAHLAGAPAERAALVRRTVNGALGALPATADTVADALQVQRDAVASLRSELRQAFDTARDQLHASVEDGSLFRGEVLGHWQNFAGHGGLIALLETRAGTAGPILRGAQGLRAARVRAGLVLGAVRLFTAVVDRAAATTAAAWRRHPYGEAVIDGSPDPLDGVSAETTGFAEVAARTWLDAVDSRIGRADGSIYADAIPVIVRATLEDGTLPTGRAIDVGGGTVSLSQELLTDVFDDEEVVAAAITARADLIGHLLAALTLEEVRFTSHLDVLEPSDAQLAVLQTGAISLRRILASAPPLDHQDPEPDPPLFTGLQHPAPPEAQATPDATTAAVTTAPATVAAEAEGTGEALQPVNQGSGGTADKAVGANDALSVGQNGTGAKRPWEEQ